MKISELPNSLYHSLKLITKRVDKLESLKVKTIPVVVSLTTIPSRIKTVHITIRSLLIQDVLPQKIILWVHNSYESNIPTQLKKLLGNRFEIRFSPYTFSHRKLIHSLESFPNSIIVTCDDDLIYHPKWLRLLYQEHLKNPKVIIGNRCREISYDLNNQVKPYLKWPYVNNQIINVKFLMPVGAFGVLYPPNLLDERVLDVNLFTALSPKSDDLWFKTMTLLKGTLSLPSKILPPDPIPIIATQSVALKNINNKQDYKRIQWEQISKFFHIKPPKTSRIKRPSISVIISTFNSEKWLEKVLWSYEVQLFKDFEMIIADDGSREETVSLIECMKSKVSYKIIHVWQKDEGFQKSRILNKALLMCNSDYVLMSDGDCIARNDFISTHIKYREKGYFLSGGYFKLPMHISKDITKEDVLSQICFNLKWLKTRKIKSSFKNNKLTSSSFKSKILNKITTTKASWNGHNSSGWKTDMLSINGFDERMQYGGQDREFGERLFNFGIKSKQIRYSAICLHLAHPRTYKNQISINKNKLIRKITRERKIIWTSFGINKEKEKKQHQFEPYKELISV